MSLVSSLAAEPLRIGGIGGALAMSRQLSGAFKATSGDQVSVVPDLGSGGAIAAVAKGKLDIAISGRPLLAREIDLKIVERPWIDTPFIFVTTNNGDTALSRDDIVAVHDGRRTRWPNGAPLRPILRLRHDSQTLFMIENFKGMDAAMERLRQRPEIPIAVNDQENAKMATAVANSFTAMTLLQFKSERPKLSIVALDGVMPSVEAVESSQYTLNTRFYVISMAYPSPAASRFVEFLYSDAARKILRDHGAILVAKEPGQTARVNR